MVHIYDASRVLLFLLARCDLQGALHPAHQQGQLAESSIVLVQILAHQHFPLKFGGFFHAGVEVSLIRVWLLKRPGWGAGVLLRRPLVFLRKLTDGVSHRKARRLKTRISGLARVFNGVCRNAIRSTITGRLPQAQGNPQNGSLRCTGTFASSMLLCFFLYQKQIFTKLVVCFVPSLQRSIWA